MLKMPCIHYIDVKVMNSVSRKSPDWHTHKSAGHPCSLACLIMICSLLYVTHKEHKWRNDFFRLSWKATSICTEDVKYADNAQQVFGGKTTKSYCSLWAGVAGFCSCSLYSLLTDVVSAMKCCRLRKFLPFPLAFITSSSLYKWHIWYHSPPQRGRWFWHLHYQGMRSILLKKFLAKTTQ